MGILSRLFKIGQAEANAAIDKLEDPIKMTEQGIRDLKQSLDDSLRAYAEVKALAIRSKRAAQEHKEKAADYEQKAILLVTKAERGEIDVAESDRLAAEALARKEENVIAAAKSEADAQRIEAQLVQLDGKIKILKSNIAKYETELSTLKARAKVSEATSKLNRQMTNLDGSGTVTMLEKMKQKVEQEEALAEAYGDMADANKSLDDEIDSALKKGQGAQNPQGAAALADLKAKLKGNA